MKELNPIGYWWNAQPSNDMPIYNIDGVLYCAGGWNGEAYTHSFRVLNAYDLDTDHPQPVTLRPVYVFQAEGIDPDTIDEMSDEWDRIIAIADFIVE